MKIKSIATDYKNCLFRSRLEARWAVFLTQLKVKWEYEVEGYDLDGIYYLPDFWLPEWGYWAEIKPGAADVQEVVKCEKLAQLTSKPVILIQGSPGEGSYNFRRFTAGEFVDCWMEEPLYQFAQCRRCKGICFTSVDDDWDAYGDFGQHTCKDHDRMPLVGDLAPRIQHAYKAAKQARFEYGSSGWVSDEVDAFFAGLPDLSNDPGRWEKLREYEKQLHKMVPDAREYKRLHRDLCERLGLKEAA